MKFHARLVQIVSLGHATFAAASTTEHDGLECLPRMLPLEMRDQVVTNLSMDEYAQVLRTSKQAREIGASDHVALELLKRGAQEFDSLDLRLPSERDRIMAILAGLSCIIKVHATLAAGHPDPEAEKPAGSLESRFNLCAGLSTKDLWRGICMAGIVSDKGWKGLLTELLPKSREENMRHLLFAAVVIADLELIDILLGDCELAFQERSTPAQKSPENCEINAIVRGIALRGSASLLAELQMRMPNLMENLPQLLVMSIRFGREAFYNEVLPLLPLGMIRDSTLEQILLEACWCGFLDIVRDLHKRYPQALTKWSLREGLRCAAQSGHLPIVQFLAWDENHRARDHLDKYILMEVLADAALHNRPNILEFLLCDFIEPYSTELRTFIPKLFIKAAMQSSFAVMDLLLERDSRGDLLAPRMHIGYADLSDIVAAGNSGIYEYVWRRQKTDPRFQHLDRAEAYHVALMDACSRGNLSTVKFLLQVNDNNVLVIPEINLDTRCSGVVYEACRKGHDEIINMPSANDEEHLFLYRATFPNLENKTPLLIATACGRLEVVQFLLQRKPGHRRPILYPLEDADLAVLYRSALKVAAENGQYQVVKFLLARDAYGAYIHPGVAVPEGVLISLAAQPHHADLLKTLLQHRIINRAAELHQALQNAKQGNNHLIANLLQEIQAH